LLYVLCCCCLELCGLTHHSQREAQDRAAHRVKTALIYGLSRGAYTLLPESTRALLPVERIPVEVCALIFDQVSLADLRRLAVLM